MRFVRGEVLSRRGVVEGGIVGEEIVEERFCHCRLIA